MKTTIIAGTLAVLCLLGLKVGSYYDGLMFTSSWQYPFIVLPVMMLSALYFIINTLIDAGSILFKKRKVSALGPPLLIVTLFIGLHTLNPPFPSFTDGLHDAVKNGISRESLMNMARDAREMGIENHWADREKRQKAIAPLIERYPDIFSISLHSPGLSISENSVSIYYGGSLSKHWGLSVTNQNQCPRDYLPETQCRKVYENVWVYKDIW